MTANLEPEPGPSIPLPAYAVTMSAGRQVQLHRLPSGGCKLVLAAPAKQSDRMIVHGQLDFSEARALETLFAISEICRRVDEAGLPT